MSMESPQEPPPPPVEYRSVTMRPSGLATASMVLGIASVPLVILMFSGAVVGVVAIALGIGALVRIKRSADLTGRVRALCGIILGAVAILLASACYAWLSNI